MTWPHAKRILGALGAILDETDEQIVIRQRRRVLSAALTAAFGEPWFELATEVAAEAPATACLERNLRLAHGAFCLVDGVLVVRAALPAAGLSAEHLEQTADALLDEAEHMEQSVPPADPELFGHFT